MMLVVLESPYAGDVATNERYARACMLDCLKRGEAPFAGHLLYTQTGVLNDSDVDERHMGISAHLAWSDKAEATVVYVDLGLTPGMEQGVQRAIARGRKIEYRKLHTDKPTAIMESYL